MASRVKGMDTTRSLTLALFLALPLALSGCGDDGLPSATPMADGGPMALDGAPDPQPDPDPDPCDGVACGMAGTCVDRDGDGVGECLCEPGYDGRACDQCAEGYVAEGDSCVPSQCSAIACDNGTCNEGEGCVCDEGYSGSACDVCAVGFIEVDGACVNELPLQGPQLRGHFDAAAIASIETSDGAMIDRWQDLARLGTQGFIDDGGSMRRPQQIVLPTPAVRFDGEDDVLVSYSGPLLEGNNHYTIFLVASWADQPETQTLLQGWSQFEADQGEVFRLEVFGDTVRFTHDGDFDGARDEVTLDFPRARGPQLVIAERLPFLAGTAHRLHAGDAVTETTVGSEDPLVATPMLVAGRAIEPLAPVSYLDNVDGDFHELIFVRGSLTNAQRQAVVDYLRVKWSL